MENTENGFFSNAVETLEPLVLESGAELGAWGTVNLIEGYRCEAGYEQIAEEYRERIHEIGKLMEHLYDDKAADKIRDDCFEKQLAEYEDELAVHHKVIAELKVDIEEKKKQGIAQLMAGARAVIRRDLNEWI